MSIKVKTEGWIMGRNGLANLTVVEVSAPYDSGGREVIKIDGVGKRGVINGGLEIEAKVMTELAVEWLTKHTIWQVS